MQGCVYVRLTQIGRRLVVLSCGSFVDLTTPSVPIAIAEFEDCQNELS